MDLAFELQKRLVQTCIDFINEHKDDERVRQIERVEFNADCLQESAEHGEWHPCTDSYCALNAVDTVNEEWYLIDESY